MINLPYSSMMVCFNENLKVWVKPEKRQYKFFYYFLCASISGTIASIITNPMDVVKTRLQVQSTLSGMQADISSETVDVKYKDLMSSVKKIFKQEGIHSFSKGMLPRAIQASMSSALSWVSYEFIKNVFLNKLRH